MKHILMATVAFVALVAPALAQNATGAEISAAISGNTVQGSMDASGVYTEFYAEGGTVFGPDYKAAWTIEGDWQHWCQGHEPT